MCGKRDFYFDAENASTWSHRASNISVWQFWLINDYTTVKQSEWDMKDIIVFAFLLINQNMCVCVCFMSATCSLRYQHRPIRNSLRVEHWFCLFAGRTSVCLKRRRCICCCRRCTGPATAVKPSSAWTSVPSCSIWACSHAPDTLSTH